MPVRTWPILAIACATLVVLIGLFTVATWTRAGELERTIVRATERDEAVQHALESIRRNTYLSSLIVRNYLLHQSPLASIQKLDDHRSAVARHLAALKESAPSITATQVTDLSKALDQYWQSVEQVFNRTNEEHTLLPHLETRRETVIRLTEQIALVNVAGLNARRSELNRTLRQFDAYLIKLAILTLLITAVVAVVSVQRVSVSESRSRADHRRALVAEANLRRLSNDLIRAQEEERKRLSRELHDQVGQMLTALRIGLTNLERAEPAPTKEFSDALDESRRVLEQIIEGVRDLAMGLRPAMLDDLGLGAAIEWQAREFSRTYDTPVSVNLDADLKDLTDTQSTSIYRIVQEALTNCARHANAKSVRVDVIRRNGSVMVSVEDDGIGFSSASNPSHFGLVGIQERVRELAGSVVIESAPGRGTKLVATLPVAPELTYA